MSRFEVVVYCGRDGCGHFPDTHAGSIGRCGHLSGCRCPGFERATATYRTVGQ